MKVNQEITHIIFDTREDEEIVILRKNDYCLLINDKVLVKSVDGGEWLCDEELTQIEFQALQTYLGQL